MTLEKKCAYKIMQLDCMMDKDCEGYDTDCPSYTTMTHIEGFHLAYDIDKSIESIIKQKKINNDN